ncbi:hydroxymethylbilane synthase [Patescibacteria group bacterium]|nr:hydroxymethylbilane synthase [Patescibacteria group bacterium]
MQKIVFGIRESRLARAQLDEFIERLIKNGTDMEYEIKTVKTKGDKDRVSPIEELGQGIFIKEIEQELISGNIDCAVHSLKDMPVKITQGTVLACMPPRADERDCLVSREGIDAGNLKKSRIAAGSPRRCAFILEEAPDIETLPLRGNVDTRLNKLRQGRFDAVVLASCGLKRLGYERRISRYFDSDTFVPAGGQGAICGQVRQGDTELYKALSNVSCRDTELSCMSERRVLEELGIGCRMAFGVFARFRENTFIITAKAYIEETGSYVYCRHSGPGEEYGRLTDEVIGELKDRLN